eukprot:Gb_33555 [translate_table: standard]
MILTSRSLNLGIRKPFGTMLTICNGSRFPTVCSSKIPTISGLLRLCLISSSQSSSSCCIVTNSIACSISSSLFMISARASREFPILPRMKTCSFMRPLLVQISYALSRE